MESPFKKYVNTLFECRLAAKKEGNDSLSFVYKILMNSLYGRFGINPKSTRTEICDAGRSEYLVKTTDLIYNEKLVDKVYIVSYHSNTEKGSYYWEAPKNAAVQIAAAITAYARIHMHQYVSRDDCYYTDTDSVVLGKPLPDDLISSTVLGKFKLEDILTQGRFLAPKAYLYWEEDGSNVKKFKGPTKDLVTPEWFDKELDDPYRKEKVQGYFPINTDFRTLSILSKDKVFTLGIKVGSKRKIVFDEHDDWVDTSPREIIDISYLS
ncbi:hypothetical protein RND81_03G084400 [Saponaria officinalis]|uniref:DNA-directed DNA polymerase n=1 Tax=Saponaria officinalis TaxID=3572 RepID=A0AAW1M4U9_SAPOF